MIGFRSDLISIVVLRLGFRDLVRERLCLVVEVEVEVEVCVCVCFCVLVSGAFLVDSFLLGPHCVSKFQDF